MKTMWVWLFLVIVLVSTACGQVVPDSLRYGVTWDAYEDTTCFCATNLKLYKGLDTLTFDMEWVVNMEDSSFSFQIPWAEQIKYWFWLTAQDSNSGVESRHSNHVFIITPGIPDPPGVVAIDSIPHLEW
jgi:hypothetical protein